MDGVGVVIDEKEGDADDAGSSSRGKDVIFTLSCSKLHSLAFVEIEEN